MAWSGSAKPEDPVPIKKRVPRHQRYCRETIKTTKRRRSWFHTLLNLDLQEHKDFKFLKILEVNVLVLFTQKMGPKIGLGQSCVTKVLLEEDPI